MSNLLLVPTRVEADLVRASLGLDHPQWTLQICGFGPIAAAARTGALIMRHSARRVVLVGIAGSFDVQACAVGSARMFHEVASYGIGCGSGDTYASATKMGWLYFDGDDLDQKIGDRLRLPCGDVTGKSEAGLLLTSPTASADIDDARRRLHEFPDALAEDMEGFAVALACQLASVPLCIVRGISNRVGDRDRDRWDIHTAMRAACGLVDELIERTPIA